MQRLYAVQFSTRRGRGQTPFGWYIGLEIGNACHHARPIFSRRRDAEQHAKDLRAIYRQNGNRYNHMFRVKELVERT